MSRKAVFRTALASLLLAGGFIVFQHLKQGAATEISNGRESNHGGEESQLGSDGSTESHKSERGQESADQKIKRLKKVIGNKHLEDATRGDLMLELVTFYAKNDPSECWKWVKSLKPDDPFYVLAVSVFATNVASTDRELWMNAINESPSQIRKDLIFGGVVGLAENEPHLAWQEFQALKDLVGEDQKDDLGNRIMSSLAAISPAEIWPQIDISGEKGIDNCKLFFSNAKFPDQDAAVNIAASIKDPVVAQTACEAYVSHIGVADMEKFLVGVAGAQRSDLNLGTITAKALDRSFYKDPLACVGLLRLLDSDQQRDAFKEKIIMYVRRNSPDLEPSLLTRLKEEE